MLNSLLIKITKQFPEQKKSSIKNVLIIALAILQKETVCLNKLKTCLGAIIGNKNTQADSHYKRIYRFFYEHSSGNLWLQILKYVFQLLDLKSDYLLLDGTSWERGNKKYHYITLCIVYQNVAIPIYWKDLNKKGQSNQIERLAFLKEACSHFCLKDKTLIADREYIGIDWFEALVELEIDFLIRIRKTDYHSLINSFSGKSHQTLTKKVLNSKKSQKAVGKTIQIKGKNIQFVIAKKEQNATEHELVYLFSTLEQPPISIALQYQIRWKIECCFKHLKSNGFQLENMNVQGTDKSHLLMAMTVFAYTLSVYEGLKSYQKITLKDYANGSSFKTTSVFRVGIAKLLILCHNLEDFAQFIHHNFLLKQKPKIFQINHFVQ